MKKKIDNKAIIIIAIILLILILNIFILIKSNFKSNEKTRSITYTAINNEQILRIKKNINEEKVENEKIVQEMVQKTIRDTNKVNKEAEKDEEVYIEDIQIENKFDENTDEGGIYKEQEKNEENESTKNEHQVQKENEISEQKEINDKSEKEEYTEAKKEFYFSDTIDEYEEYGEYNVINNNSIFQN